jgi:hypothetical protein
VAEIVNLRQARKRKKRTDKEVLAAGNRVRFGRPKGETRRQAKARDRAERDMDGKKLD